MRKDFTLIKFAGRHYVSSNILISIFSSEDIIRYFDNSVSVLGIDDITVFVINWHFH